MEFAQTLLYMQRYIDYAHFWGTIQLKFDNRTKTLVLSNSIHSVRNTITIGAMILERCALVIFLTRDILNHNFGFQDKFDILQMAFALCSFYCLGNHVHTFWKGPEIASTVNSFLLFYNDFQGKEQSSV